MKSSGLKIAVAGCGYWGKNLLRNFWELGYLSAIYDTDENRINEFKTKYSGIRIIPSFEELLKDKEIEGIVVAAPAVFHHSMVKESLLNDKHVFVEKPLALNINDGKELVDLANDRKKILMVGHILQYHNAVIKLKELIDSGELGKIQYIYSNRLNIGKIRSEENILWSFAPHDISVILGLLGEMPESVCASGGNYLQKQVADVTLTTMNFPSGVKAHIFVSWLHPFKEQKLVVVGSKKMAVFDDLSEEKLFLYSHSVNWINRLPIACKSDAEIVPVTMEEPLKKECQHFIDCIKNESVPVTSGDEGLRVLTVLEAAQKSLNNNGQISYVKENGAVKEEKSYYVHESSYIDANVKIGSGTKIWHFSHILKNSTIGDNCKIGQNVVIGPYVTIGNGCKIQSNISIYEGVTLEDEVFCGPSMVFTNVFNPRSAIVRMSELRPTLVKKGATIGANATIVCGNTIGRYAFIGAGAVVIEDVPDYALVVGNPAQIIGWMCECGIKLKMQIDNNQEILCEKCNKKYINENGVTRMLDKKKSGQ